MVKMMMTMKTTMKMTMRKIRMMAIRKIMRTPLEPLYTTMAGVTPSATQTGGTVGTKLRTKPLSAIGAIEEDGSSPDESLLPLIWTLPCPTLKE